MKYNNTNDSVIIINKINNTTSNNTEEPTQINNTINKKELISINMQVKIFAVLLMLFAVMLFIALATHTAKDEPNLQIKFTEMFGLFSNDPIIKMKFDTTINSVGLIGAIISNLLINEFIGIWIIGLPIVLFLWGIRLIKKGEIENNIVTASYTYIIIAVILSCLFGALSCFEALINMPLYLYGSIGAFFGTIISNIISPIGSTIIFTATLILTIYKLIKINPKQILLKLKNINNIKLQIITKLKNINNYLYRFFTEKDKEENINKGTNPLANNNAPTTCHTELVSVSPVNNEEMPKQVRHDNDFARHDNNITQQNTITIKENIFNKPQEEVPLNIKDILPPNIIIDDLQINKFKGKINKNVFKEENATDNFNSSSLRADLSAWQSNNSVDNGERLPRSSEELLAMTNKENITPRHCEGFSPKQSNTNEEIASAFTMPRNDGVLKIDDAVFTFNPPQDLKLPQQTIIPKNEDFLPIGSKSGTIIPESGTIIPKNGTIIPKNGTIIQESGTIIPKNGTIIPKNGTIIQESGTIIQESGTIGNESLNIDNEIITNTDLIDTIDNAPIKIDLSKPKLTIEIEDKQQPQVVSNYKSFKNPLSLGVMDEKIDYTYPTFDLLDPASNEYFADDEELQRNGRILQEKLETFKINISNLEVTRGPVVTQYEFVPADGVKINKIEGLSDDLAMALKAKSVHIIAPVPEKGTVGIQIPNSNPSVVRFRSVIASKSFAHSNFDLPLALGKTVSGEPYIADLTKMPHLLIAGSTGSGKSVGVNTIISSLLYKKHPSQLKFIVIDPKKVELTPYARLSNHFLAISPDLSTEIVTEPSDAIVILKAAVLEMEKRYTLLEIAKQRNIKDYNEKVRTGALRNDIIIDHRELPYLVVIVDELADLMLTAGKEIELPIVRLAQMARAVGIHLIIATQRPSVNIITGIIKANFPSRIAYLVASKIDSRTILDASGAEALLGNGDMLFSAANQVKAIRIQNPFISTDEVERLCDFIGNQIGYSEPYILPSTYEKGSDSGSGGFSDASAFDPLFREAAELIIMQQLASTSMLQRRLKIGFARAGRIIDELASAKVIGPPQGSKPRVVLMESMSELERVLK